MGNSDDPEPSALKEFSYLIPYVWLGKLTTLKELEIGLSFQYKPISYVNICDLVKLLSFTSFGYRLTHLTLLNIFSEKSIQTDLISALNVPSLKKFELTLVMKNKIK